MAGQCPGSLSALRPSGCKSGCGRQPAKSVWLLTASQTLCLPHPRVGKISFPGHTGKDVAGALRTAGRCGILRLSCLSSPHSSYSKVPLKFGPNSLRRPPRGPGTPPRPKKVTQPLTGGHAGDSRFCRRFAIRCCSAARSSSANCRA